MAAQGAAGTAVLRDVLGIVAFRTAMLLLRTTHAGLLDDYAEMVRDFHSCYSAEVWFVLYTAEVRMRSERFELLRRAAENEHAKVQGQEDRRASSQAGRETPVFADAVAVRDWHENFTEPAVLYRARTQTAVAITGDGAGHDVTARGKGAERRAAGAVPWARRAREANAPARRRYGPTGVASRTGATSRIKACEAFNRSQCGWPTSTCPRGEMHRAGRARAHIPGALQCSDVVAARRGEESPRCQGQRQGQGEPRAPRAAGPVVDLGPGRSPGRVGGVSREWDVLVDEVDVVNRAMVNQDVADDIAWGAWKVKLLAGRYYFVICGTPCETFSRARQRQPRPPRCASSNNPRGHPALSEKLNEQVRMGNFVVGRTAEACAIIHGLGAGSRSKTLGGGSRSQPSSPGGGHRAGQGVRRRDRRLDQCRGQAVATKPTSALQGGELHRRGSALRPAAVEADEADRGSSLGAARARRKGAPSGRTMGDQGLGRLPGGLKLGACAARRGGGADTRQVVHAHSGVRGRRAGPPRPEVLLGRARLAIPNALRRAAQDAMRQKRNDENVRAVGGRRCPTTSVRRVAGLSKAGTVVRRALEDFLGEHVLDVNPAADWRQDRSRVRRRGRQQARGRVLGAGQQRIGSEQGRHLGRRPAGVQRGVGQPGLPPPPRVARERGALIGILNDIPRARIFPDVQITVETDATLAEVVTPGSGWVNYAPVENEQNAVNEVLGKDVEAGVARVYDAREALKAAAGTAYIAYNEFALISKVRDDNIRRSIGSSGTRVDPG